MNATEQRVLAHPASPVRMPCHAWPEFVVVTMKNRMHLSRAVAQSNVTQ